MLAAKLNSTRSGFDLVDAPDPQPGAAECVIEVAACGICASDLRFLEAKGQAMPGVTLGHEATGTVVALGERVDPALLGRAVAIDPLIGCGDCGDCLADRANRCPERGFLGIHRDGSFAGRVAAPAANLVPLPDDADLVAAALTEPFSVARHGLGPDQAETVAVIGAGGIGLAAIVVARARGASRVLAIDRSEAALRHAAACGAEPLLAGDDLDEGAFDQVLECTGAPDILGVAITLTAPAGEVVLVGIGPGQEFPVETFVRDELLARGAFAYTHDEVIEVAQGIASGVYPTADLEPEQVPLIEISDAVDRLRSEPGVHSRHLVRPEY